MKFRFSLLTLLAAGILGVLLHCEQQRGAFEFFDRWHREALWRLTGADRAPWRDQAGEGRVMLARLDDADRPPEQRVFDAWPPGPLEWQVIFQNLKDWNPRVVAVAPPVAPGRNPAPVTTGFANAAQALPGLVLGIRASAAETDAPDSPPEPPPGLPVLKKKGRIFGMPGFQTFLPSPLPQQAGGVAEVDLGQRVTVKDGRCLVPMVARGGGRLVPTLALRALLMAAGVPPGEVVVEPGKSVRGPGGFEVPIDAEGNFRFYPPLAPEAETVAADIFLFTREQAESLYKVDAAAWRALTGVPGALLWVGLDDAASRRFELPGGGGTVSGAEVTARALTALRSGRYLEPLEPEKQAFTQCCAIGAGLAMVCARRKRSVWTGAAAGALLLALTGLLAFHTHRVWVPCVPALLQLALGVFAGLLAPSSPAASATAGEKRT